MVQRADSAARALGVDGSPLREMGLAALMHDIGKVRTPTEILNKPEKLTDSEFAVTARGRRRRASSSTRRMSSISGKCRRTRRALRPSRRH